MKVVGLITEYNPFHNGHKYHIEEAKRLTGADYAIVVMSGNFVQRGTPAVIDKYSRTEMALRNGIDLVIELPACYATGSAEYFAHGAVSLLDKLGVVDTLCFGSECGDISLLSKTASFLLHAPETYENQLQDLLKEGLSYPAARQKAMERSLQELNPSEAQILSQVMSEPNNILGIEYMKAIDHLSSSITPVTIQRISAHYHARELTEEQIFPAKELSEKDISPSAEQSVKYSFQENDLELCNHVISSATAIRNAIHNQTEMLSDILSITARSVPNDVTNFLSKNYHITYPITEEDFAGIIKYKLRSEDSTCLATYMDITPDLAERLKNLSDLNKSIAELAQDIKTKNMTLTRINRALIHILLNIKTDKLQAYMLQGYTFYARVLGIRKESSHLLRKIEKNERIPIITKVSKASDQLDEYGLQMLSEDIFATHLYNQAVYDKYGTAIPNEYKHGISLI